MKNSVLKKYNSFGFCIIKNVLKKDKDELHNKKNECLGSIN